MAIRQVSNGDLIHADKIRAWDPFQLAPPLYVVHPFLLFPIDETPHMRPTREQLEKMEQQKIMAIRTVEAAKAPGRLFVRGGISSKQDYVDLLTTLSNGKPDQAYIVDMDPKAWVDDKGQPMKKAEVTFANSLRRRFDATGVPVTAYMSGTMQITVRRLNALELKEKQSGKGKRKK